MRRLLLLMFEVAPIVLPIWFSNYRSPRQMLNRSLAIWVVFVLIWAVVGSRLYLYFPATQLTPE